MLHDSHLICLFAVMLLLQLDSGKKQKGLLAERIADMELAAAAGEGDIKRARAELAELEVMVQRGRCWCTHESWFQPS
jgi:hypothetical protein